MILAFKPKNTYTMTKMDMIEARTIQEICDADWSNRNNTAQALRHFVTPHYLMLKYKDQIEHIEHLFPDPPV